MISSPTGARNGARADAPFPPQKGDLFSLSPPQRREGFEAPRQAALALLTSDIQLTRKAGSFLGQCVVDPAPLTQAQHDWLTTLLRKAGLPTLSEGGDQ